MLASTLLAYHGIFALGFVYDDRSYILENRHLTGGGVFDRVAWAFTSSYAANWHPLTWISHLFDVQLFGLAPAGHHATSLLLHVANTLLLFTVLRRLTGAWRPSALAAALFALHPLHVESVAWVSERKDVLSALFWLLGMEAYRGYAARGGAKRYAILLATFVLGAMAKPMVVTFPFALLLLDFWPLGRTRGSAPLRRCGLLLTEKIPLFAVSVVASVLAVRAQSLGGAVLGDPGHTIAARIQNALVSYVSYLGKTFWPDHLAIYYPLPAAGHPPASIAAAALLVLVTTAAIALRRRAPSILMGWFWFLGTLLPVIGLVQVGMQAYADRYTYLPHIGLFTALAWGARELRPLRGAAAAMAAVVVLAALAVRTAFQVTIWRDEPTVYGHAVAVTKDNWVMHYNLALVLAGRGRTDEAVREYQETLRIKPSHWDARADLARALQALGRYDEAIDHVRLVVLMTPGNARVHKELGALLEVKGHRAEALAHFREAVRLEPDNAFYRALLDLALAQR